MFEVFISLEKRVPDEFFFKFFVTLKLLAFSIKGSSINDVTLLKESFELKS